MQNNKCHANTKDATAEIIITAIITLQFKQRHVQSFKCSRAAISKNKSPTLLGNFSALKYRKLPKKLHF